MAASLQLRFVTAEQRKELISQALTTANQQLKTAGAVVHFFSQWPPKANEVPNFDQLDERPDIDLTMDFQGKTHRIDIVYIRSMPQDPEKLLSASELASTIVSKTLDHIKALQEEGLFLSISGTKFVTRHLKNHQVSIDHDGYLRINSLRIAFKNNGEYHPIKAANLRSHTRATFLESEKDFVTVTDDFDRIRTDGRTGMYCVTSKANTIATSQIGPLRQEEARSYEKETGGQYIPMVRNAEDLNHLLQGTSSFFQ